MSYEATAKLKQNLKKVILKTNKIWKAEPFIKFGIYSSWNRLCHILSYVKRFIKNYRSEGNNLVGSLATYEIKVARQDLIKNNPTGKFCRRVVVAENETRNTFWKTQIFKSIDG